MMCLQGEKYGKQDSVLCICDAHCYAAVVSPVM
jgi:hypothetical protein